MLNDIGPVVEGEGLAHIRAYLERAPKPKSMADAVAIQRATHGQAFSALTDADWTRMAEALYRMEKGRPVADFDRRLVKTLAALDLSRPIPQFWPQFDGLCAVPLMVIRGENSKLLSAATVEEMARRHPSMVSVTVAGQGHPPMLETGDLPARIAAFLDQAEARKESIEPRASDWTHKRCFFALTLLHPARRKPMPVVGCLHQSRPLVLPARRQVRRIRQRLINRIRLRT